MTSETGAVLAMSGSPTDEKATAHQNADVISAHDLFTIGEIAREFDFTLRALRFYEEKGLISPQRNGNRRLYSQDDRKRLEIIADCKKVGMPLEDIRVILQAEGTENNTAMTRIALEKAIARLDALEVEKARIERHTREALALIDSLNKKLSDKTASLA